MTNPIRFSHFGIFVNELEAMVDFYAGVLGLVVTDRGLLGEAGIAFLSGDAGEHHQVVLVEGRAAGDGAKVVNQIAFRVTTLAELKALRRRLADEGLGPVEPINHGHAWSLYFRDPEGNRIELFVDTGWHITQPCREPLDLDRADDEIIRDTEAFCRARPGFAAIAEWRQEMAKKLAR